MFGLGLASPGQGHDYRLGHLVIDHPWARVTAPAQRNGAAYLVLRNEGDAPDRLLGASSGIAREVELHSNTVDALGVARMRPVESVEIPAGGEVMLAPSNLHLMLVGLGRPLVEGERFPLTLRFERAGEVTVEVPVEGLGGPAPAPEHGHDAH